MPLSKFKNILKANKDCSFFPLNYSFHLASEPNVSMFSIPSGSCSCFCLKSQGEGLDVSLWAFS